MSTLNFTTRFHNWLQPILTTTMMMMMIRWI